MDSKTEKNCLEEISTLIFDVNEKVSLKTISNTWNCSYDVALNALSKWLDQNQKKVKDIEKEFLVRGLNKNGAFCISVVPESKKHVLENRWKNFRSQLFSVDSRSNSRKLDLPDFEPIKVKNIMLSLREPRDLHVPDIPIIKEEPAVAPKAKTPFSVMKPAVKAEVKKETKVKEEKPVPVASPEKKSETIVISDDLVKVVKSEKPSPEDPKTSKAPVGKKTQLKNQKPVQKGSISSFFSNKPGTSKAVVDKPKEKPVEISDEEDSPIADVVKKTVPKAKKQPATSKAVIDKAKEKPVEISDEEESEPKAKKRAVTTVKTTPVTKKAEKKKPETKKIKLKEPSGNKRSRILVMQDSSEEEDEAKEIEEPESKFIKFDREFTPEEASPVKVKETPEKQKVELNKRKAKRWVTKRFQTDDGFISTERVQEEYSASEDENDENKKKNSPPSKEKVPAGRKSSEKKKPAKAKPAPTGKSKQGSITSFFTKK